LRRSQLYNDLLLVYEKSGILPNSAGISNTLVRLYSIDNDLAVKVTKDFVGTLRHFGFLDDKNILRISNIGSIVDRSIKPISEHIPEQKLPVQTREIVQPDNEITIIIPLKEKGKARLILPEGYDDKDLKRIAKFVDALKDTDEEDK
jgi:hypothetical protein